jgi:hypothetical protein
MEIVNVLGETTREMAIAGIHGNPSQCRFSSPDMPPPNRVDADFAPSALSYPVFPYRVLRAGKRGTQSTGAIESRLVIIV